MHLTYIDNYNQEGIYFTEPFGAQLMSFLGSTHIHTQTQNYFDLKFSELIFI